MSQRWVFGIIIGGAIAGGVLVTYSFAGSGGGAGRPSTAQRERSGSSDVLRRLFSGKPRSSRAPESDAPNPPSEVKGLSPEEHGRVERSLAVLGRIEQRAIEDDDDALLARVNVERGRLLRATTGVGETETAVTGTK